MKTVRGVKRYAKKFLTNVEMAEIPQAIEQLQAVVDLMEKDKGFRALVISPIFSNEERQKTLSFILGKMQASEKVNKYLEYLMDEKALAGLPEIMKSVVALYLDMKKRARAVVTSPAPISAQYEEQLKQVLRRITGRDIDMEVVLDPGLLGGVRIRVGSTMYDGSIKGQLGLLKDKFIEG